MGGKVDMAAGGKDTRARAQKSGFKPLEYPAAFTPGGVAEAFAYELLDEEACRAWIIARLHPAGPACPACGLRLDGAARESFRAGRRCVCGRCGRRFTARSRTVLEGAQLEYRQVYLLAVLLDFGFAPARIAEIIKVTPGTVRFWAVKFRFLDEHENGGGVDGTGS